MHHRTHKEFCIPKAHFNALIAKHLKIGSSNIEANNIKYRISKQARKLLQAEVENFISEIFSRCKDVQRLNNKVILKKKVFVFCAKQKQ